MALEGERSLWEGLVTRVYEGLAWRPGQAYQETVRRRVDALAEVYELRDPGDRGEVVGALVACRDGGYTSVTPKYTQPVARKIRDWGERTYEEETAAVESFGRNALQPDTDGEPQPGETQGRRNACKSLASIGVLEKNALDRFLLPDEESYGAVADLIESLGEVAFVYEVERFCHQVKHSDKKRDRLREHDLRKDTENWSARYLVGTDKQLGGQEHIHIVYGDREYALLEQVPDSDDMVDW